MERKVFMICDPDPEFVFRFMEFAKMRSTVSMEIRACTTEEHLRSVCEKTPPELLLISSELMSEEIRELSAGVTVLLQEDRETDSGNLPSIYKYQPPEELLRTLQGFMEREQRELPSPGRKEKMQLIGIYSPVGRTRKTTFALTLGQILARNRAVLYLNLETFAGFEQLFSEQYERTLSDLLYFGGQKEADLQNKLAGMTRSIQNLDYVPPVVCPEDLQSVEPEEWKGLFRKIGEQTGYEVLLLDFGEGVRDLPSLLAECSRIYMPVRKDPMSRAKLDQFFWVLENLQGREVCDRVRRITLPFCQNGKTGKEFFTDLVWSELGDCVRQMLSEEGTA